MKQVDTLQEQLSSWFLSAKVITSVRQREYQLATNVVVSQNVLSTVKEPSLKSKGYISE